MKLEEALFCGRALFSFMEPMNGELVFGMKESKPTARTQAALDLLVDGRYLSVKVHPDGKLVYVPLVQFRRNYESEEKAYEGWLITEPVK